MTRCFIVVMHIGARFHPTIYREAPLPGRPENLVRFKSVGHHTESFPTSLEADHGALEMAAKMHGYEHPLYGTMHCPPEHVVLDNPMITDEPVSVMILPSFDDTKSIYDNLGIPRPAAETKH